MVQLNQIVKDTIGLDLSALASTLSARATEAASSTAVPSTAVMAAADGAGRAHVNGDGSRR
jgi:hypothetical protein